VTGVIVVGGSIGGVRTVQQLRRAGYAGTIALVERERHLPYDKPPSRRLSWMATRKVPQP